MPQLRHSAALVIYCCVMNWHLRPSGLNNTYYLILIISLTDLVGSSILGLPQADGITSPEGLFGEYLLPSSLHIIVDEIPCELNLLD